MQIEEILNRLDKVTQRGEQYTALCPAHDDKKPSLAITQKDEKILLKCWSGCNANEITGALGLKLSDLFIDSDLTPPQRQEYRQRKTRRQLIESLFHEAHILLQYLNDRNADTAKASDSNYLKLHPEFVPLSDEPFERELKAAIRTKKIIGQLYGI